MTEQNAAGQVALAYVHQDDVAHSFHQSMLQVLNHDMMHDGRIWSGGLIAIRGGTDGLAHARNTAVKEFLTDLDAEWLWWVDTDMGFPADAVERLLEAADPEKRPVMGALCFANREVDNDGMGGRRAIIAPVIMYWTHDGDEVGFDIRWDYPTDGVVRCDGVGSACILIHRSVLKRVQEHYGNHWYSRARNPSTGELIGEDLSFCARLMALDIPIHVHTGVKTTHAKRIWLSEDDYWAQRAVNQAPTRRVGPEVVAAPPRTWTVPRFAVVPTHNRPARLLSLVVSLGSQCDDIVVLDNASSPPVDVEKLRKAVPERVNVEVIRDEEQPPHLSRYWNVLLDRCAELAAERGNDTYDVAVFNDDSVVPAGWYTAVADGLRNHPDAVVGFTDTYGLRSEPTLMTELDNDPKTRMCPWAFVVRGESGLRADENMRWWFFDTDFDLRARQAGGVLSVPGPAVANVHANSTTTGLLAEQAHKDKAVFDAKWAL